MSTYTISDPFINTANVIDPLQLTPGVENQYSVKVTIYNPFTKQSQIYVFTGELVTTIISRSLGFQSVIMSSIETFIKTMFDSNYSIGILPRPGYPVGYASLQQLDILVSFSDYNDYFIIRGDGVTKSIIFISNGAAPDVYTPGIAGTINNTYVSNTTTGPVNAYSVIHNSQGNFSILINSTDTLTFDGTLPVANAANYKGADLTVSYDDASYTAWTGHPDDKIGVTYIATASVPADYTTIPFAEKVAGIFWDPGAVTTPTAQSAADYVVAKGTFTTIQGSSITCLIKSMFIPIVNCVKKLSYIDNPFSYSSNNGYSVAINLKNIVYEIKLAI